jgi:hypothetical protein
VQTVRRELIHGLTGSPRSWSRRGMWLVPALLLVLLSTGPDSALACDAERGAVWSRDPTTGEEGLHRVTRTFVRSAPVMELEVIGDDATDLFVVTGEHPFWRRDWKRSSRSAGSRSREARGDRRFLAGERRSGVGLGADPA